MARVCVDLCSTLAAKSRLATRNDLKAFKQWVHENNFIFGFIPNPNMRLCESDTCIVRIEVDFSELFHCEQTYQPITTVPKRQQQLASRAVLASVKAPLKMCLELAVVPAVTPKPPLLFLGKHDDESIFSPLLSLLFPNFLLGNCLFKFASRPL